MRPISQTMLWAFSSFADEVCCYRLTLRLFSWYVGIVRCFQKPLSLQLRRTCITSTFNPYFLTNQRYDAARRYMALLFSDSLWARWLTTNRLRENIKGLRCIRRAMRMERNGDTRETQDAGIYHGPFQWPSPAATNLNTYGLPCLAQSHCHHRNNHSSNFFPAGPLMRLHLSSC